MLCSILPCFILSLFVLFSFVVFLFLCLFCFALFCYSSLGHSWSIYMASNQNNKVQSSPVSTFLHGKFALNSKPLSHFSHCLSAPGFYQAIGGQKQYFSKSVLVSADQECPPYPQGTASWIGVAPDLHTPSLDWNITLLVNSGGFSMDYRLLIHTFFYQHCFEFYGWKIRRERYTIRS